MLGWWSRSEPTTRGTSRHCPDSSSSFARAAITLVASVSAGPPWGGLYLNPPSRGGLWLGVTTIPSARPSPLVRSCPGAPLAPRMATETAGVGV